MARSIFAIIDELQSGLAELAQSLAPLRALAGTMKGGDGPFPMTPKKRHGVRRRSRAAAGAVARPRPGLPNPRARRLPAARANRIRSALSRAKPKTGSGLKDKGCQARASPSFSPPKPQLQA